MRQIKPISFKKYRKSFVEDVMVSDKFTGNSQSIDCFEMYIQFVNSVQNG